MTNTHKFFEKYQKQQLEMLDCLRFFYNNSQMEPHQVLNLKYSEIAFVSNFFAMFNVYCCIAINYTLPPEYQTSYQQALVDMSTADTAELDDEDRINIFAVQQVFRKFIDTNCETRKVAIFPNDRHWSIQSRNRYNNGYGVCDTETAQRKFNKLLRLRDNLLVGVNHIYCNRIRLGMRRYLKEVGDQLIFREYAGQLPYMEELKEMLLGKKSPSSTVARDMALFNVFSVDNRPIRETPKYNRLLDIHDVAF